MKKNGAVPASVLHIQGDGTAWGLATVEPQEPAWGDSPVQIDIIAPVAGTLILSPARVGSYALVPPATGDGWMPAFGLAGPTLYIPTPQGLTAKEPGYLIALRHDQQLAALQEDIVSAMSGAGSSLTVDLSWMGGGVAILNGAHLPFLVLGNG
jgi:hypothetical protein